ncbi:MAG TPA: penicillin-binding protein 2 [Rhodospirillaceae bacterium]|nr:MAG: penicillin-binding protein 2 [Alphaproteobacteria bacterium GWF2_58_20]HAU29153.1 penicillin-binding protein 2 [Rhodospirillaceae bacterium]
MEWDTDRFHNFTRRALLLGGVQGLLLVMLGGRLHWLQVKDGRRYSTLAEKNRIDTRRILAPRGRIFDRFGVPLAVNEQNFRLVLIAENTPDIRAALEDVGRIVPVEKGDILRVMRDVRRKRPFMPVTVMENLSWEQVARIELAAPELPGLSVETGQVRQYPQGKAFAHVVGYVGAVQQADLRDDPLLGLPGVRIGKVGIEKTYEEALRGSAGEIEVEVNALGRSVRELGRIEGKPGEDLSLALDAGLQEFVQKRLAEEKSATAVVMDVQTGEIYALASHPAFDSNMFSNGIPAEVWEEVLADPAAPLSNKAIGGQYPPGSAFKMVTALAALESGTITPGYKVHCPGYVDVGSHRFHCWKSGGHGDIGLEDALTESCDVFFYDIGRKTGINQIAQMAELLGLGAPTGIDLPGERPGLVPNKAWKLANRDAPWQIGETIVAAIGQGYVLATPLQLAVMTARMVGGGVAVAPHLALNGHGDRGPWASLGISRQSLDIVMAGMRGVMCKAMGTARDAQIPQAGMEMGGKTGTAQVRRITKAERAAGLQNKDMPWRFRHHALFVGYAPLSQPRYACAVVVEHGVSGSATAAPIARDILWEAQKRDTAGKPKGSMP